MVAETLPMPAAKQGKLWPALVAYPPAEGNLQVKEVRVTKGASLSDSWSATTPKVSSEINRSGPTWSPIWRPRPRAPKTAVATRSSAFRKA